MPIEFSCPACRQLVRTPDAAAGKKGRCPQCRAVVQIPEGERPAEVGEPDLGSGSTKSQAPVEAPEAIEFYCMACGQLVRTPAAMAGKKGKCPQCRAVVRIPAGARPASAASVAAKAHEAPLATSEAKSRQLRTPAPAKPSRPELTPMDDDMLAALTPYPSAPRAPTNPFSATQESSWQGAGESAAGNPFASSAMPDRGLAAYAAALHDDRRRGLSWDDDSSLASFFDTAWTVIGTPHIAFESMHRRGGLSSPLGFMTIGVVTTQVILLLFLFILFVAAGLYVGAPAERWPPMLLSFGISALLQVIAAIFGGMIGSFLGALPLHVALLLVGGANSGFETTYRVHAFGVGSVYLLLAVPILGFLMFVPMYFVVLAIGLMYAHETSGLKATFAVLAVPAMLLCCLFPFILLLPALM